MGALPSTGMSVDLLVGCQNVVSLTTEQIFFYRSHKKEGKQ